MLPRLAALGHEARAIDLPAHGPNPSPAAEASLGAYVAAILAAIDQPVVLVGHSLGGIWITAAAEAAPGRIDRLVYLTAWCPTEARRRGTCAVRRIAGLLMQAMQVAPDGLTLTYRDDLIEALFYHDCPPGTVAYARAHLAPEPVAPDQAPVRLGANYASVPARTTSAACDDRRDPAAASSSRMSQDWPGGRSTRWPAPTRPSSPPARLAEILCRDRGAP